VIKPSHSSSNLLPACSIPASVSTRTTSSLSKHSLPSRIFVNMLNGQAQPSPYSLTLPITISPIPSFDVDM